MWCQNSYAWKKIMKLNLKSKSQKWKTNLLFKFQGWFRYEIIIGVWFTIYKLFWYRRGNYIATMIKISWFELNERFGYHYFWLQPKKKISENVSCHGRKIAELSMYHRICTNHEYVSVLIIFRSIYVFIDATFLFRLTYNIESIEILKKIDLYPNMYYYNENQNHFM